MYSPGGSQWTQGFTPGQRGCRSWGTLRVQSRTTCSLTTLELIETMPLYAVYLVSFILHSCLCNNKDKCTPLSCRGAPLAAQQFTPSTGAAQELLIVCLFGVWAIFFEDYSRKLEKLCHCLVWWRRNTHGYTHTSLESSKTAAHQT